MSRVLVIGFGPAAHRFAERLRHHGHDGPVTVLGADERPAYHRGLLTAVLAGPLPATAVTLPASGDDVDVRTGVRAVHVDRHRRTVVDDRGGEHPYDELVLATGERTRDPAIAGLALDRLPAGVRTMRTVDDVAALRGDGSPGSRGPWSLRPASGPRSPHGAARAQGPDTARGPWSLRPASGPRSPHGAARAVVVGGGHLGTEVALTLARTGRPVDLVHPGPYPMHRHLDERAGGLLAAALAAHGVTLHAAHRAVAYRPWTLVLRGPAGNTQLPAPTVVLTTGAVPETGVSGVARLTSTVRECTSITARGVDVDDRLRTTDPRVSALGGVVGTRTLAAAWAQADVLARRLTGDDDARHVPPRALVRLRVGDVDVAAAGRPGDGEPDGGEPDGGEPDDVMTVADRAGTRYARLDLRGGRLVAASVIGFPHAAGALGQHWALDAPLPTARLALLLGTPATVGGGGPEALPDDAVVCVCNTVTKGALVEAWRGGAADVDAIATATLATTGCGTCVGTVRRLLAALEEQGADA